MIIAIDGHSACGKSTLSKDLARKLHLTYIDSGAMYRAATLFFIQNEINPKSEISESILDQIHIDFIPGDPPKILLNNNDVTEAIRNPIVSELVSEVSVLPDLRRRMVALQRQISADKSVVMDGRDIGSVVFKNADFKFFVTADLETRAKRRFDELIKKGINIELEEIKSNLMKRDHIDSNRNDSPLIQSPDSILIDNSTINQKEQLDFVLKIIKNKVEQSTSGDKFQKN